MIFLKQRKIKREDYDNLEPEIRDDSNTEWIIEDLDGSLSISFGSTSIKVVTNVKNVLWSDLVELRDKSTLESGTYYRIIDYETKTTQEMTTSAGHLFDIITLAIDCNKLSEQAFAAESARDEEGYFSNSNLNAWQVWYSLDNDVARFSWADIEEGKGVIYRLIDEFNNDLPYDFKNIKHIVEEVDGTFEYYTFKYTETIDGSLSYAKENKVYKPLKSIGIPKLILNSNTFIKIGNNCDKISLDGDNISINIGDNCLNITTGFDICNLNIGSNSYNIEIDRSLWNIDIKHCTIGSSIHNKLNLNLSGTTANTSTVKTVLTDNNGNYILEYIENGQTVRYKKVLGTEDEWTLIIQGE